MEKQLRKLDLLFRLTRLKPEMFYTITVYERTINLQGLFNSKTVIDIKKIFGEATISDNGFIEFSKNNISIILT